MYRPYTKDPHSLAALDRKTKKELSDTQKGYEEEIKKINKVFSQKDYDLNKKKKEKIHEVEKAFKSLKDKLGDPEVLHYNAAKIKDKHILRESIASISSDMKVNVGGALHSVKQVVRPMKKAKKGTLLFTGGGLALNPHANYGSLSIGKAAMLNLVKQLGKELAYAKIKVGTVVVKGYVQANDPVYNPTMIADEFWKIHQEQTYGFRMVEY